MNGPRLLAISCTALAAMSAVAQSPQMPDGRNIFKGKMKPGLYEQVDRNEMKGLPGLTKEQEKGTETKQRCLTQAELDRGLEFRRDCKLTRFEETGSTIDISSLCPDGSTSEFKLAVKSNGFASEMSAKGRNADGSPFSMSIKSEARYLGSCRG